MARDYHGRDPGERWPRGAPDDASGDGQGGRFREAGGTGAPLGQWDPSRARAAFFRAPFSPGIAPTASDGGTRRTTLEEFASFGGDTETYLYVPPGADRPNPEGGWFRVRDVYVDLDGEMEAVITLDANPGYENTWSLDDPEQPMEYRTSPPPPSWADKVSSRLPGDDGDAAQTGEAPGDLDESRYGGPITVTYRDVTAELDNGNTILVRDPVTQLFREVVDFAQTGADIRLLAPDGMTVRRGEPNHRFEARLAQRRPSAGADWRSRPELLTTYGVVGDLLRDSEYEFEVESGDMDWVSVRSSYDTLGGEIQLYDWERQLIRQGGPHAAITIRTNAPPEQIRPAVNIEARMELRQLGAFMQQAAASEMVVELEQLGNWVPLTRYREDNGRVYLYTDDGVIDSPDGVFSARPAGEVVRVRAVPPGQAPATLVPPSEATSRIVTGTPMTVIAHIQAGAIVQAYHQGAWRDVTGFLDNEQRPSLQFEITGLVEWFDYDDPATPVQFVHTGRIDQAARQRQEYNAEIEDAVRLALETARDSGNPADVRRVLAEDYGATPSGTWNDAYSIRQSEIQLDGYRSATDPVVADAAIDYLAIHAGLADPGVFGPPPMVNYHSEGFVAEPRDLVNGLYGRPEDIEVLVDGSWRPVISWELTNGGQRTSVALDGAITLISPAEGHVEWRLRPSSPDDRLRQTFTPPPAPVDRVDQAIREISNPPAGRLPGDAATIREALQHIEGERIGYGSIPVPESSELYRRIHAIWAYTDDDSGLESRVTSIWLGRDGGLKVGGLIYDENGRSVGNWERDAHSYGEIHHSYFRMNPDVQGDGFTTRWFEQVLDGYRHEGFERVTVHANIDVGGYTWTRWFDYRSESAARHHLQDMRSNASWRLHITPETLAEIDALLQRIEDGGRVTAREVSRVGYARRQRADVPDDIRSDQVDEWIADQGSDFLARRLPRRRSDGSPMEMWLGKAFMLGQSWGGVMEL